MADDPKLFNMQDGALALMLLMDLVATFAKVDDPIADPFLRNGAVTIMPDGVALYDGGKFREAMQEMAGRMVGICKPG